MLRRVACQQVRRLAPTATISSRKTACGSRRLYAATSGEKRALKESQLKGEGAEAAKPPTAPAGVPPSGSGGGGGSALPVVLVVAAAGGAGVAYYQGLIPGISPHPEEVGEQKTVEATQADGTKGEEAATAGEAEDTPELQNKVTTISLPEGSERSAQPEPVTDHPTEGNRVLMEPATDVTENAPTADKALDELQSQLARETSIALKEAHKELAKLSSLDASELDSMTESQLKIRLVQLAKDLEERTKWEAVRLKEFLAMKEKEVEDKYLVILKKQRLETEATMDRKLKEQEYDLTSHMQKTISEKEAALQSIVDNSLKLQEQQFNEEKATFEKSTEESLSAKYEELFGKSLAEAKQSFASKLEQKVQQIEALTKKLSELELALQNTKHYQTGSIQAHRMSAAALSLIDILESSKPAGPAITALQSVAENNAVITSALSSLPAAVKTSGTASLSELQANFEEKVHSKCREAALVPEGQTGLEGQILGMLYATLKFPPSPEDAAPEGEEDNSEYVLARARRHVQLGELEPAIAQMDKLKGQAAVVAKDWTQAAKERVAIEQALKVIRLECALANESMSKAGDN